MTNRLHRECAEIPIRKIILRQIKNILQGSLINKDRNGLRYLMMKDIKINQKAKEMITVKKLMEEHKRLLDKTNFGAWDIYYELCEFIKK